MKAKRTKKAPAEGQGSFDLGSSTRGAEVNPVSPSGVEGPPEPALGSDGALRRAQGERLIDSRDRSQDPFGLSASKPSTPSDGPLALPEALRLERNLALMAGAGTGKTYSLVTLCLHLLAGARAGKEPLPPGRIGLLTFTDKAAGEMRERLRHRVQALADGKGTEPELVASLAAAGRAVPPPSFWRGVVDDLGGASIGTFHSLCVQLLRRAPPGSGVNPSFELLDERTATQLVVEALEQAALELVGEGDAGVESLVRHHGLGVGARRGLASALAAVFTRLREEGLAPSALPRTDAKDVAARFAQALDAARKAAADARLENPKQADVLAEALGLLERATLDGFGTQREAIERLIRPLRATKEHLKALKALVGLRDGDSHDDLPSLWAQHAAIPAEEATVRLLERALRLHGRALERRRALDFTGLLVGAVRLLREVPEARREAQARFGALLVDEFQDTNRVQLELVTLLAERREGAPRPLLDLSSTPFSLTGSIETLTPFSPSEVEDRRVQEFRSVPVRSSTPLRLTGSGFALLADRVSPSKGDERRSPDTALPLEPAFLAVVGDRKQSIYEFRGADVSVFEVMARRIEASGGGRAFLSASRRSTPRLVRAFNAYFAELLAASRFEGAPRDFEVAWSAAEDELTTVRTVEAPGPAIVRVKLDLDEPKPSADEVVAADALAVARAVAALLASREPLVGPKQEGPGAAPRPVRGGDVALLFRRFGHLERYRQALVKHGVRHRVIRGRGFYGAQEVVDLASLLSLLVDPDDAVSFAAVLRSPLVGLTDESLVRLALEGPKKRLAPRVTLFAADAGRTLPAGEQERLARFLALYDGLRRERDRLGLAAIVRLAVEGLELRLKVAGAPFGDQAAANLDKLLALAQARERQGESVAGFARELLELAEEEPTEAQGEVLDESDPDVVTLCTVHQAKGLEWPVVVLPDLCSKPPSVGGLVRFEHEHGLSLKPVEVDGEVPTPQRLSAITRALTRRQTAERLRLLYVALTRARDRVVLGLTAHPQAHSWAQELLDRWPATLDPSLAELDTAPLAGVRLPSPAPLPVDQVRAEVEALVARVRTAPPAHARTAILPVTQLEDAVQCPRRYQLAHQVGLSELPKSFEWREEDEAPAAGDARSLGISAHRLLELVPLALGSAGTLESTNPSSEKPFGLSSSKPSIGSDGDGALRRAQRSGGNSDQEPVSPSGVEAPLRNRSDSLEPPALDSARAERSRSFARSSQGERPVEALRRGLVSLARAEALPLGEDEAVLGWVERFLTSSYGRALGELGDGRVRRETPFVLALDTPRVRDFRLLLRGQIDLLVERDGTIDVVDYKTTHRPAAGLEPYQFQLSCYALAARALWGKDLPVRAGIAFLMDEDPSPQFLEALPAREALGAQLVEAAQGLMRAQVSGVFATRPRARCVELGCGYVYRCHGEAGRV